METFRWAGWRDEAKKSGGKRDGPSLCWTLLVTFINTKGNICLEEFLMLLMDQNFNPFAISNKQTHIISGNLPELRYSELGFSLTQLSHQPLLQFFTHSKELLIILAISILAY